MSETIKFDPNKDYNWKADDKIEITGQQFMVLIGLVRGILSTEEAAKVQLALQANGAIQQILANAVINGIAVEATPPSSTTDEKKKQNETRKS